MAVLNKRYTNRWQAQISYVFAKATGNVDNTRRGAGRDAAVRDAEPGARERGGRSELHADPRVQAAGDYQIPKNRDVGQRVFPGTSGLPYNSDPAVPHAASSETARRPRTRRINIASAGNLNLPTLSQLDLRIEKNFNCAAATGSASTRTCRTSSTGGINNDRDHTTDVGDAAGRHGLPAAVRHAGDGPEPAPDRIGARWSF